MSLTKFKNPSLRDKQELKDQVEDPRLKALDEDITDKTRSKVKSKKKK